MPQENLTVIPPTQTGPKTVLGKQRSRMNAIKHGLRSTDGLFIAHLSCHEREILKEVRQTLHTDYDPQTSPEKFLVDRIAIQYLRLFRLYRLEHAAAKKTFEVPFGKESIIPHLDRLSRYDWRVERQLRILHNRLRGHFCERRNFTLNHYDPQD